MNKLYLSSVLLAIFALPAFANIDKDASTATCDSSTIGATSGTAYMDTDWTANTINLQWYSNGEQIDVTGTDSATCTYDGTITLPSDPQEPTGYTFGGWKVRVASNNNNNTPAQSGFDLSTWNYGTAPDWDEEYTRWKCFTSDNCYSMEDDFGTENSSDLSNGEWAVTFGNGTVKGVATCSAQGGNNHNYAWGGNSADWSLAGDALTAGEYNDTDKKYCWCKATSVDTAGNGSYTPVASSSWVFRHGYAAADNCAYNCAVYCTDYVRDEDVFRRALFGISE